MSKQEFAIIAPCFNENVTVISFLKELESVLRQLPFSFKVIIVDDASTDNTLHLLQQLRLTSPNVELTILSLKYNAGHQGAIYQGLLYARSSNCQRFIVMDSDGEDDPEAIRELVYADDEADIVNVVRGRRKESLTFRFSYHIYRLIFKVITGRVMNFGNYCMISNRVLATSCHTSFVHFAAHLSKQRVKTKQIVYNRRKRIDGKSKMNLTSLVHHAFKSFVEYAEDLLMMFLKIFAVISVAFAALIGYVLYKKFITHEAILGWASTVSIGLLNVALLCLGFFVIGILLLNILARKRQDTSGIYQEITPKQVKSKQEFVFEEVE
ncbi:glycosyltransferase [Pontibacter fetidus]|uniref:Glycosyltransferase n=1 Tax=Pontibacter fetidus TaxID=2700082 RepID=A0A6B2H3T1_9BACT|nr:glycosyltransferase [Pontibacter fetidus]NDK55266.1 glycosyltransferase [Pontibacter fetidus]